MRVESTDRLYKGFMLFREQQIIKGLEFDQCMSNRGLFTHVKCTMMIDVPNLFDEIPKRKSGSWNTIIIELVDFGNYLETFRLFLLLKKSSLIVDLALYARLL